MVLLLALYYDPAGVRLAVSGPSPKTIQLHEPTANAKENVLLLPLHIECLTGEIRGGFYYRTTSLLSFIILL